MADELIDIYDEEMNYVGSAMKYVTHAQGLWHKIFFCWVVVLGNDGRYKAVLQLRNKNKKIGGGMLDASSAGHFSAGETLEQAVVREVNEELGLKVNDNKLVHFGTGKRKSGNEQIKNWEICEKCYLITNHFLADLTLQRDELDGAFELDVDDAIALFGDDKKTILLNGLVFNEKDELKPLIREVSIADFMDYGKTTYRDFFIKLRDCLKG